MPLTLIGRKRVQILTQITQQLDQITKQLDTLTPDDVKRKATLEQGQ